MRVLRSVAILLAVIAVDVTLSILGVAFVTAQHNARDAIAEQKRSSAAATARINEYRAQQARDHATIEQLVAAQSEAERQKIAQAAADAAVVAANERLAQDEPPPSHTSSSTTSTTQPRNSTTTSTAPSTTTTTTPPPRSCVLIICR